MSSKKLIREMKDTIDTYTFEGKLIDIRRKIEDLILKYGESAFIDYSPDGYTAWSETSSYGLFVSRLETDKEYNDRIQLESSQKEFFLKQKREQFEQLKKELGEN